MFNAAITPTSERLSVVIFSYYVPGPSIIDMKTNAETELFSTDIST